MLSNFRILKMCISRGLGCRSENSTELTTTKSVFHLATQMPTSLVVSLWLLGYSHSNLTGSRSVAAAATCQRSRPPTVAEGAANATVQVCYEGQRREPYNSRKPYSSVRIKTYNLLTASLGLRTEQCVLEAPAAGGGGGESAPPQEVNMLCTQ